MSRIEKLNQHYILCGANLLGTRIAEELHLQGRSLVVIDTNEDNLKRTILYTNPEYFAKKLQTVIDFAEIDLSEYEDLPLQELSERVGIPYIQDEPTNDAVLVQAGIDRAVGMIAAMEDDRDNLSIVIGARSLANRADNTSLRIMARVENPFNVRKMYLAGADAVRIPSIMGGVEMASHIMHPEVGNWWYNHISNVDVVPDRLQQVALAQRSDWVQQTVGQIHKADGVMIVSVKRGEEFISPPPHDLLLQTDDIAIVIGM